MTKEFTVEKKNIANRESTFYAGLRLMRALVFIPIILWLMLITWTAANYE
jgi:hypothetical protein